MFEYEETPHPVGDGIHRVYRFENGYGASVVRFRMLGGRYGSYTADDTEWEVAVIKFTGDEYTLTYDTHITSDVVGGVKDGDELKNLLKQISELPAPTTIN